MTSARPASTPAGSPGCPARSTAPRHPATRQPPRPSPARPGYAARRRNPHPVPDASFGGSRGVDELPGPPPSPPPRRPGQGGSRHESTRPAHRGERVSKADFPDVRPPRATPPDAAGLGGPPTPDTGGSTSRQASSRSPLPRPCSADTGCGSPSPATTARPRRPRHGRLHLVRRQHHGLAGPPQQPDHRLVGVRRAHRRVDDEQHRVGQLHASPPARHPRAQPRRSRSHPPYRRREPPPRPVRLVG